MKANVFSLEEDPFMQIFRSVVCELKPVYNYAIKLDKYKKYIHKWWFWKYSSAARFLLDSFYYVETALKQR